MSAAATPEIRPAAADADDHDIEVGQVLEQLEADRPVPGDDRRIVERVDELEALGVADPLQLGERLADVGAVEDDPRPVAEAGLDLRAHGAGRHDDRHRDAGRAPGPGVGLPGVPGRQRDDAARPSPSAVSVAIRLVIPRALNEPVFWRCSGLQVEPVVAEPDAGRRRRPARRRSSELSSGVRWTRPASRSRAASISATGRDGRDESGHGGEYARAAAIRARA